MGAELVPEGVEDTSTLHFADDTKEDKKEVLNVTLWTMKDGEAREINTTDYMAGQKLVLISLGYLKKVWDSCYIPGIPETSKPFVLKKIADIEARGATVAVTAANDHFVLGKYAKSHSLPSSVALFADRFAALATQVDMGLEVDGHGMGLRSKQYVMVIDDSKVVFETVGDREGKFDPFDSATVDSVLSCLDKLAPKEEEEEPSTARSKGSKSSSGKRK